MKKYFNKKVEPVEVKGGVSELIGMMGKTGFQAKNLSLCVDVWEDMLNDNTTVFLGLAGAMVPAGMRKILAHLIKNRFVDCLVSTGANLFHDIHETMGKFHWQGHHMVDDVKLMEDRVDRIYDVFASDKEFEDTDRYILDFSKGLDTDEAYTTRSFLKLLGKRLLEDYEEEGILTSAYKAGVPVYCPAIGDSSIGIALSLNKEGYLLFDTVSDVEETARIVLKAEKTGVVYIGGGTPKNFIQQTEVTAKLLSNKDVGGHEYAIQVTADAPHWGGLSGCTFEEAQSWGKISEKARQVMLYCDSTIALPLIVSALSERMEHVLKKRNAPDMSFL